MPVRPASWSVVVLAVMLSYGRAQATEVVDHTAGVDLAVGMRYQSGDSVVQDVAPVSSGAILTTDLFAFGERSRGDRGLRVEAELLAETLSGGRGEDYQVGTLRVGPTLRMPSDWWVYAAAEGAGSFYDYEFFSTYGGGALRFERSGAPVLRSVALYGGVEDFDRDVEENDAWLTGLEAHLGIDGVVSDDDGVFLWPAFTHNHARDAALRYSEFAGTVEYGVPVASGWTIFVDTVGWRRVYDGAARGRSADRRDWYWSAGTTVVADGLPAENFSIEARYAYERNWSNDGLEEYDAHTAAFLVRWTFDLPG